MERGIILLWSGAIADIPSGFVLCDGNNGTPDLRDQFLTGAGGALNPDDSGGNSTHTHNFTGDGHTHIIGGGPHINAGGNFDNSTVQHFVTGTTDTGSSLPPYYALAFIMKT